MNDDTSHISPLEEYDLRTIGIDWRNINLGLTVDLYSGVGY